MPNGIGKNKNPKIFGFNKTIFNTSLEIKEKKIQGKIGGNIIDFEFRLTQPNKRNCFIDEKNPFYKGNPKNNYINSLKFDNINNYYQEKYYGCRCDKCKKINLIKTISKDINLYNVSNEYCYIVYLYIIIRIIHLIKIDYYQ